MTFGQISFLALLVQLAVFVACCWLWFWLTKVAIREGIRESGLVEAIRRRSTTAKDANTPDWAKGLPDMRAD